MKLMNAQGREVPARPDKVRGLLMKPDLVVASLKGWKTQTMRVMNPQPAGMLLSVEETFRGDLIWPFLDGDQYVARQCPYGQVGDLIYPRETWWQLGRWIMEDGKKTWRPRWTPTNGATEAPMTVSQILLATWGTKTTPRCWMLGTSDWSLAQNTERSKQMERWFWRKTPSIHMPKDIRSFTATVLKSVPVRLSSISAKQCLAEGLEPRKITAANSEDIRQEFFALWESINGDRPGCSVADDPWCWRIVYQIEGKA